MNDQRQRIAELRRTRPRNRFVRASVAFLVMLAAVSWALGGFSPGQIWGEHGRSNAARFLGELRPWPLQGGNPDSSAAFAWAFDLWRDVDAPALLNTLAISVAAICLAGVAGVLLGLAAARNLACPRPFLPGGRPPGRVVAWSWRTLVIVSRALLVALRSIPEYVWAFLLLALLGPSAWPMVLALALHNAGILGKLSAEVIENVDARAPGALSGLGAGRLQVALGALYPLTMPRFLLYFFYRWETCVREATVLGMLGMSSLGFLIVDARSRNRYDEMMFHIGVAAVLVIAGEIVSGLTRRLVRRA